MLLPHVDAESLIIERDHDTLSAYARGLWQHLSSIRAGGPNNGYPIATIRAATVWLIGAYCDADKTPDPEAYQLVAALIKPDWQRADTFAPVQWSSRDAYHAAIMFEATHPADPTGRNPSAATLYAVAKHVREGSGFFKHSACGTMGAQKSAESTMRGWRNLAHYRTQVRLRRPPHLRRDDSE